MCQRSQCGVSILIPSSGIFFHLCRQNLSIPLIYDVGHHIKCESESGPLFDTSARFPLGGEGGGGREAAQSPWAPSEAGNVLYTHCPLLQPPANSKKLHPPRDNRSTQEFSGELAGSDLRRWPSRTLQPKSLHLQDTETISTDGRDHSTWFHLTCYLFTEFRLKQEEERNENRTHS